MRVNDIPTILIVLIGLIIMLWAIDHRLGEVLVLLPIMLVYFFFSYVFSLTYGPLIFTIVATCLFRCWMNAAKRFAVDESRKYAEKWPDAEKWPGWGTSNWEYREKAMDSVGFSVAAVGFLIGCIGIFFSIIVLLVRLVG